ncbi:MAG TPA: hypothetical protein PLG97_03900 [Alcaligenes sp.]|nr:hypothetical protein [Alcaligenes sp.]HRL26639.1 hypothetical protein [Alcaligenes sp.]
MIRHAALAAILWVAALPAHAACTAPLREFALLAEIGASADTVAAYRALPEACRSALLQAGKGQTLPAPTDTAAILSLGRRVHQDQIAQSSNRTFEQLAQADIPDANVNALQGLGPDNAFQALSGMALDIASAGLASQQRWDESHLLGRMARQMRGNERHWSQYGSLTDAGGATGIDSSATGPGGSSPAGSNIITTPALPMQAVQNADCMGDLSFLAPQMRAYAAPELVQVRESLLGIKIQEALADARRVKPDKQQAIAEFRRSVQAAIEQAQIAADAAENTDGYGNVAVPKALSDELPLGYSCGQGSAVHASSVCMLIMLRWQALALSSMVELIPRCWR